jgi:hypothetical protein
MKKFLFCVILIASLSGFSSIYAQGFQPPSAGKAVVYFVRATSFGFAISFEYFHQDKYIGAFKGKNYMRYECDPGEQLFWASSENKEFVTADLQEGGTYIVSVWVKPGAMKGRVIVAPITVKDESFIKVKELINTEKPVVITDEDIQKKNKKLEKFIAEKLKMYNEKWKNEKKIPHISSDMAIPEADMK